MKGLIAFSLVLLVARVSSYGSGAPTKACKTMIPGHTGLQTTAMPFKVTLSTKKYNKGSSVKVTVTNTTTDGNFKGILLQVRKHDKTSTATYGNWTATFDYTKTRKCNHGNDSATHSKSKRKPASVDFTWTAPCKNVGELHVMGTFALEKHKYWVGYMSDDIEFDSSVAVGAKCGACGLAVATGLIVGVCSLLASLWNSFSL